jgi:Spy/CpxP family protein refolding chaperone
VKTTQFSSLIRPLRLGTAAVAYSLALGALAVAGSATGATPAVLAQAAPDAGAPGGAAPGGGRHLMAEALMSADLSDKQKDQIRGIMRDVRQQNANADPTTRRANYKAAFEKIDTVLSPAQRAKVHAKLAELRKERDQAPPPQS